MAGGWTYIPTNRPFGVLYIGVTADIARRITAHREGRGSSFCRRFNCTRLVLAELHPMIEEAIQREKTLKNWTRAWKLRLISDATQDRDDLMERYNG